MNESQLQSPRQSDIRRLLRRSGIGFLAIGGLLTLVGVVDFFASAAGMHAPRLFWCIFLGMPLAFVGTALLMFGFFGAVQRYVAGEAAPVAKDVVNYMGENTQPGVKAVAKAITEGIREGLKDAPPPKG